MTARPSWIKRNMRGHRPRLQTMKCPTCKNETEYAGNPNRPFCSERCKLIDLGQWAGGDYRVPTNERPPEEVHRSNGNREEE
jgi:uncharacterized protein